MQLCSSLFQHIDHYSRTKAIAEQMVLSANGCSLKGAKPPVCVIIAETHEKGLALGFKVVAGCHGNTLCNPAQYTSLNLELDTVCSAAVTSHFTVF